MAFSAQKVSSGTTCKVYKQKATYQNKVFTCIKSGKKLVWNKGVSLSKPKPTPPASATPDASGDPIGAIGGTPTPTKSAAPFVAKIPIALPVLQSTDPNAITFTNVMSHISEIPRTAWQKVQDVIASSNASTVKHDTYIGPNTQLSIAGGIVGIDSILERATKLWAGFTLTKYFS